MASIEVGRPQSGAGAFPIGQRVTLPGHFPDPVEAVRITIGPKTGLLKWTRKWGVIIGLNGMMTWKIENDKWGKPVVTFWHCDWFNPC